MTDPGTAQLPRVVMEPDAAEHAIEQPGAGGALWRLEPPDRDLDANLIWLPPHDRIADHPGADVDVLWHIVAGSGTLQTEGGEVALSTGQVVYLPRRARRAVLAGPEGLRYLSVHQRRHRRPLVPTFAD